MKFDESLIFVQYNRVYNIVEVKVVVKVVKTISITKFDSIITLKMLMVNQIRSTNYKIFFTLT